MKFGPIKKEAAPNPDTFTNLISERTIIDGSIWFTGIIKIQGEVNGSFLSSGNGNAGQKAESKAENDCIIVDKTGSVNSKEIFADDIVVSGKISSETIHAAKRLYILKGASITGATILYGTIDIEQGAILHECTLKSLKHLDY